LAMRDEEIGTLTVISRSRTEAASRVERAQMLLAYRENLSFLLVGRKRGVHHQTVQRCIERALAYGVLAALDDRPRPGKEATTRRRQRLGWCLWLAIKPRSTAIRTSCGRHGCWRAMRASADRWLGTNVLPTWFRAVCKILGQDDLKPHKVRYYLERRDAEFERKMAEVLCVYRRSRF
jgi:hypothetical protein